MSHKQSKKMRKGLRERINNAATSVLRREIFRLARNRDILGIVVIVETITIVILGIALCR
jgi:type IV secretory pathway component VirB8